MLRRHPRHAARITTCALVAFVAMSVACATPAREEAEQAGAGTNGVSQAERSQAERSGAGPHGLDDLLATVEGPAGRVPPGTLAALRDSTDPAEQRAYRLLALREDVARAGGVVGAPAASAVDEGQDSEEAAGPSAPVALVVSDAAAVDDGAAPAPSGTDASAAAAEEGPTSDPAGPPGAEEDDPAASATADAETAQPATTTSKKSSTGSRPKPVAGLTMITRIALNERGNDVELDIVAAGPLAVGSARGESEIRVVVEDAGALPAALQARPSTGGVRVTDVRRGDETVQIAVELPSGWKVASKRSTSSGARVRFAAR